MFSVGDEILPSLCGDYFINHEIRIPLLNSQYNFDWKVRGFFFVAQLVSIGRFFQIIGRNIVYVQ